MIGEPVEMAPPAVVPGPTPRNPPARRDRSDQVAALSRMLRGIGTLVLLTSASTFLFKRWGEGGDLERYGLLLGHSVLLSIVGFFCAVKIKESKGARTLLAIGAAVVPIHFCVLGGFVYSQFSWDGGISPVPTYASWMAPDPTTALATVAVALAVLAPLTLVSFLALVRARALGLTVAYLAMNGALLVPTRDPDVAGVLLLASSLALAYFELRQVRHDAVFATFEARLVRIMLAVPAALLIGRSLLHYDLSILLAAAGAFASTVFLLVLARAERFSDETRRALEWFSVVPLGLGWADLGVGLHVSHGLAAPTAGTLGVIGYALSLTGFSISTVIDGPAFRRFAAVVACVGLTSVLLGFPGILPAFLALVTSILVLSYGYLDDQRGLFALGLACALVALVHHLRYAVDLYAYASWGSLALLGVVVIVGASVMERHHERIAAHWSRARRKQTLDREA